MTARVALIRHGAHDLLGHVLCGRMDGVGLNAAGRAQGDRLAESLAAIPIALVVASPLLRAQQTAAPIAARAGLPLHTEPALNEIDLGSWTGARFEDLATDPAWQAWNTERSRSGAPGGESMADVQTRIAAWLASLANGPDRTIIAVSHADVIKVACCHALDVSLDTHRNFDIDPGSITTLLTAPWGLKLVGLNAG